MNREAIEHTHSPPARHDHQEPTDRRTADARNHGDPTPDGAYDGIWAAAAGKASAAGTPAVASPAAPLAAVDLATAELVNTRWFIDYQSVGGKTTKLPDRYASDQMIVDSLRILPAGESQSIDLSGGNMADSGAVFLGSAKLNKGPGSVSAAVRYAKKTSFDIKLELEGRPTQGDKAALHALHGAAYQMARKLAKNRGDYEAIGDEIAAHFADRFPGNSLRATVLPLAKGQATEGFVADAADYAASHNAKFMVAIDLTGSEDHAETYHHAQSAETGTGKTEEDELKSTATTETKTKRAEKQHLIESFQTKVASGVQEIFKGIEEALQSDTTTHNESYSKTVGWTLGIEPSKEKEPKPDDPEKDGGILKTIEKTGSWLYTKGKAVANRFPIVKTVLSVGETIWDGIQGRGMVSRKSDETDGTADGTSNARTGKHSLEIDTLANIATELSTRLVHETEHAVDKEFAARLGLEVSTTQKRDETKKKSIQTSVSGSIVTHEIGQPRVVIKRLD